jgi:hypothetical protein
MKSKYAAAMLAAIALATGITTLKAQPTNWVAYNFDTDQVSGTPYGTAWGNWFGGYYQGAIWDNTVDVSNNPSSGSLQLTLNCTGSDQYVLNDGINPAPNYGPVNLTTFTNLSFDMRYSELSAIRTNANGTLDFGLMRFGSRSPGFAQDWIYYWAVPATNALGQVNTNWFHVSADLTQVPINYSDLSAGLVDILIGMDGGAFGNNVLVGAQTMWIDNITYKGFIAPIPPPTLAIKKTVPALRMFGGNGVFGRSQLSLADTLDTWVGATYPVSYSFTLLGNATTPGNLDTHIQFIPLDWDTSTYNGNSGADYWAANELWLRIVSGTGTNRCVADISWKTNAPFSNPTNTALIITNAIRAGTWTLTFNSVTNGTLTAPGASPVPFSLGLSAADATTQFGGLSGGSGNTGVGIRFGNQNNNVTANAGVPDDWASISISGAAGTNFVANFTTATNSQIDTNLWTLNNSDGANMQTIVPTNAPFWITWKTPDTGFGLVNGVSLTGVGTNWNDLTSVSPLLTGGVKWALIPSASLPASKDNFFALVKRTFGQLQVLLPGETNAPGTPTGKIGTPTTVSLGAGGNCVVTINAVDSTFHIAHVSGDMISLSSTDGSAFIPGAAALVNGSVTEQVTFGSTGIFTVTASDDTTVTIPPATSSSVTVGP